MSNALNNAFKLRDVINVREPQFGAKGNFDGSSGADDTDAIQAAIEYAESAVSIDTTTGIYNGPNKLYFPPGRYKIGGNLVVNKRIAMVGDEGPEFSQGSRLCHTGPGDLLRFSPVGGGLSFSIEKLTFKQEYFGADPGHLINVEYPTSGPGYNSWRIEKCCFANNLVAAIRAAGNDVRIIGNTFDVTTAECIQLGGLNANDACTDVIIANNDFFNVVLRCILAYRTYGLNVHGNVVTQPNDSSKTYSFVDSVDSVAPMFKRVNIHGNTMAGVRRILGVHNGKDVRFAGNVCTDSGMGTGETLDAILLDDCDGFVMEGNIIRGQYDSKSMFRAGAASSKVLIGPNNWINDGGAGACMEVAGMTGRIDPANQFIAFTREVNATDYYALGYIMRRSTNLTYGATVEAGDASRYDDFTITATNNAAFSIPNLLRGSPHQRVKIMIRNASGGALGAVTWDGAYKLAAWVQPANGFSRTIEFRNDGTNWVEQSRTPGDVPN